MFYILPPKGQVALHILENCVHTRLEYLNLLEANNSDGFLGNFEYLLENSLFDSIGHFILRLIAATSTNFWPRWIRNESLLFEKRLNHLSIRQVHRLLRHIYEHTKRKKSETPTGKALLVFSMHFLESHVFNHITRKSHDKTCKKFHCSVPFASVPDLVRNREIELHQGCATVFCSQWKLVLLSLFQTSIEEAKGCLLSSSGHLVALDPRLRSISKKICSHRSEDGSSMGNITSKNIDIEAKKFPPCMQNLHSILRAKHRLSHHARFYYSLFLKECGMKLEEAIDYWKEEYSKPHSCQSSCSHSWQTDQRRFLYSIRHLYGLEGGRKNYKAPNCEAICTEIPGFTYEGGCPFKHFDLMNLNKFLKNSMDDGECQDKNIQIHLSPRDACSMFLRDAHKLADEDCSIYSPVQYYAKVIGKGQVSLMCDTSVT